MFTHVNIVFSMRVNLWQFIVLQWRLASFPVSRKRKSVWVCDILCILCVVVILHPLMWLICYIASSTEWWYSHGYRFTFIYQTAFAYTNICYFCIVFACNKDLLTENLDIAFKARKAAQWHTIPKMLTIRIWSKSLAERMKSQPLLKYTRIYECTPLSGCCGGDRRLISLSLSDLECWPVAGVTSCLRIRFPSWKYLELIIQFHSILKIKEYSLSWH